MSCGVVPNTTNTPFYYPPKQPNKPFAVTNLKSVRFPTLRCASSSSSSSSSFRAKAAVEEGGLVGGNFYELLGISEEGSVDEIKKAYKRLARKYHPDVSPPDRTEEYTRRFIEVQEAYEILSDPRLRAIYDRDLARGLHFAFSTRRIFDEELEEKSQWKRRWQEQMAELKRRRMYREEDSEEKLSWGARMRRQRTRSSTAE